MGPGLVLDFDGTILDTEEPTYRAWAEIWDDHGEELSTVLWQDVIGTNGAFDPWAELERRTGRTLEPTVRERYSERRAELQERHELRPGVLAWLREAEELGVPVAIASSSPLEWVEEHLLRFGLRQAFAAVVCSDGVVPAKPDPTSYRVACALLGVEAARSVAVEDSRHGVAAAVTAGLFTVVVPHALTAGLDLSAADVQLTSLEELTLGEALAAAAAAAGRGGGLSPPGPSGERRPPR